VIFFKKTDEFKPAQKNCFWKYWRVFCICTLILGEIALLSQAVAYAEQPVKIAIVGPMIGTSFSVGIQYKVGVSAAIQALPDGQLLGHKVDIKTYDDSCSIPIAEKVALDLVQDPPAVVIGHSCSMATLVAAPVYAEHKVLQITPASTNPQITELGIKTIFRMIGRDDVQGKIGAERIARQHADKKIGFFYFPGSYSEGLALTAISALEVRGIKPTKIIKEIASAASYAGSIQDFIDAKIEILYLVGGGLDSGVFMRQLRQMGAQCQVISGDTLVSKVFVEAAGDAGEGIPFTFPPEPVKLSTSKKAVAAIKEMGLEPVGYTLLAYAATQTWIEGVRRAHSFDADLVATAIRRGPVETVLGGISFDEKGDIQTPYPAFVWYMWKKDKRVRLD